MLNHNTIHNLDPNPGGAPVILLLHGLGANKSMWTYQLPVLSAAGFRPVAVDIPGFGESSFEYGRWSIKKAACLLQSWMDNCSMETVGMVGLSMGGVIAQQIALQAPARVRCLVLADTFAALRPTSKDTWLYLARRMVKAVTRGPEEQAVLVAEHIFPEPDQCEMRNQLIDCIHQTDKRMYKAAMWQLALFDSRRRLKEIKMPTLVICGANDYTVPVAAQAAMARRIPAAQFASIPNAGHASPLDQPDEFNRHLLAFLNVI